MNILGFNFKKISSEKFGEKLDKLNIKLNVRFSKIKPFNSELLKTKKEILNVGFVYNLDYEPNFAKIAIEGSLLLSLEPKQAKELLKQWEGKKIPEEVNLFLLNSILKKSTLKALQLEEDLGLPLHVSLPTLSKRTEEIK